MNHFHVLHLNPSLNRENIFSPFLQTLMSELPSTRKWGGMMQKALFVLYFFSRENRAWFQYLSIWYYSPIYGSLTSVISCWWKPKKIASNFVTKSKSRVFSTVSGTQPDYDAISLINGSKHLSSHSPHSIPIPRVSSVSFSVRMVNEILLSFVRQERKRKIKMYPWISSVMGTIQEWNNIASVVLLGILETLSDTWDLKPSECHYMWNTFW